MAKKQSKFIVDVVPLAPIGMTQNRFFSYLSEEKISCGSLVKVPFLKRSLEGIALKTRDDFHRLGKIELKKVEKVLEENFLTENQLRLADFLAEYYFFSLSAILKNFVPKRIKSRKYNPLSINYTKPDIHLTIDQKKATEEISKSYELEPKNYLLFGPSGSGKTEVYINSISKLKSQSAKLQFLILIPEKTLTPQALERYGAYFSREEIVILSSDVSKGQYYSNWQKIKSGEAKIIIGTRMAVFAPFKNLGLIVIDEEQDMSFKQWDMHPRYDARVAADKLAEIFSCPLVRGSATPLVETCYFTQQKKYKMIQLPHLSIESINSKSEILNSKQDQNFQPEADLPSAENVQNSKQEKIPHTKYKIPNTEIVDMKKGRWNKNQSCLSRALRSEIGFILKHKLQAIMLINRQGMSAFSVCEGCHSVLKCPYCDRALVYDQGGIFACPHCNFKTGALPSCPKCRGLVFRQVGLGTQKVKKEIEFFFPSARVLIADSQTARKKNFHEKIYADFSQGRADILVGTQMISKGWDLPRVSLVGIMDADNILAFPDYNTEEKAYSIIIQASGRINRPGSALKGKVILQTYRPENKFFQFIQERNYPAFFEQEIKTRKALDLPPFSRIIKLVFQDYSPEKTEKESARVEEILKKSAGKEKISEAFTPLLSKIRGRFRKQIVIKLPQRKISAPMQKEIEKLSRGWIVDIDPVSII